mgnify:CR=1 FL=1
MDTLVLLYQGLMPGEARQLHTDDIIKQGGFICIHVNYSEPLQRLKNTSSNHTRKLGNF